MLDCVKGMLRALNEVPRTNDSNDDDDVHAWGIMEIDAALVRERYDALTDEEREWLGPLWPGFVSVMERQRAAFESAQALRRQILARGIRGVAIQSLEGAVAELVEDVMRPVLGDVVAGLPSEQLRAVADIALSPESARFTTLADGPSPTRA